MTTLSRAPDRESAATTGFARPSRPEVPAFIPVAPSIPVPPWGTTSEAFEAAEIYLD